MSAYAGSQAFASTTGGSESVNRNTGSLTYTKTIVSLIGVKKSIDFHLGLRYNTGLSASFGLPPNWTFDIPFLDPNVSLTKDGRTYIIDFTWADELDYHSGLRYVNNHGIQLTAEGADQPLPSGQPGFYQWKYQQSDRHAFYFDGSGKLLEVDDLHGNYIYYSYVNQDAGPNTALLSSIRDSWGQITQIGYQGQNEIIIVAPDGSQTTLEFDQQGVLSIQDALGYVTSFVYATSGSQNVLDTISYPEGLQARFTYQQIAYLNAQNQTQYFAAVADHYHLQQSTVLSQTSYVFGQASGLATFTGFPNYQLAAAQDTLMESNNQSYLYDVFVANYDPNQQRLSASRIFFNFLHLPVQEIHYTLPEVELVPSYQSFYQYSLGANLHARSTNYSLPSVTEQYNLDSNGNTTLLRRSTVTYDSYGCPLESTDEIAVQGGETVQLRSHVCTYIQASWGGEMLSTELFNDRVTGQLRLMTYTLSPDDKDVEKIVTEYSNNGTEEWQPWKYKTLTWDSSGRLTSETVSSSPGNPPPDGTPATYTHTLAYLYDQSQGTVTSSVTDGAGNAQQTSHSTVIMNGPIVKKTLPMGQSESFDYDGLGRVTAYTDPMRDVTKTQYAITPDSSTVTTITSNGYITTRSYSVRGELIAISDNGTSSGRVLMQAQYDALSRPVVRTNELGLSTKFAYDALNRPIQTTDYLDNVTTLLHDDVLLTQTSYVNGQLRVTTQKDAHGRVVSTTQHADIDDNTIDYNLVHTTTYSGFSLAINVESQQKSLKDGSLVLLFSSDRLYDPEFAVVKETARAARTDLSKYDTVERKYQYDIFGHMFDYSKRVTYAEGTSYDWQSPKSYHDECGRLVKLQNQLGSAESFAYDGNDWMLSMTRYSGTTVQYSRDAIGRVISVTGSTGNTSKTYLSNGRLAKIESIGSASGSISYSYTLDGSLSSVSNADGTGQSYTLDNTDRVTKASDALGGEQTTSYNQLGLVSSRAMGGDEITYIYKTVNHVNNRHAGDSSASFSRALSYDGFDRLVRATILQADGQILLDNGYVYNSQDKVIKVEVASAVYADQDDLNYVRSYEFDGFGQLRADNTQFKSGRSRSNMYTYDGNHNIVTTESDGVLTTMTYNAIDQRIDSGFSWDADGRMLSDNQGQLYTYLDNDKVLSVKTVQDKVDFGYAPNWALSIKQTDNARELYYYDMGSVNAMTSTTDGPAVGTSYLQEPGRRVAGFTSGIKRQDFFHSEGSTSLLLEGTNAAVADYAAYGATVGAGTSTFGYKQELTDSTSGLIYLRSRYYQPKCGTFLSLDIESKENRYAYCNGDPINMVDRNGRSAVVGTIVGAVVGTVATIAVGVATGGIGAVMFGPECVEASIAAGAMSGAAGNVSGDWASAGIQGRPFTLQEGLEDVVSGGVGGAVGTGIGGFAGSRAMSAALAEGMSQRAITNIGSVTSGVVGGATGGFSDSFVMAKMNGKPGFSESTAIGMVTGAIGGMGGGLLHSGAYLGLAKAQFIPVPLTESEMSLIMPAVNKDNVPLAKALYVMAPQSEAQTTYEKFTSGDFEPNDALRLRPGVRPEEDTFDTIAAHGMGGSVFASVRYPVNAPLGEGEVPEPTHVRPIKGKLFAQHMASIAEFRNSPEVKFLSCFSAYSNAQAMANALDTDVHGSYEFVDPMNSKTKWKKFTSRTGRLHLD